MKLTKRDGSPPGVRRHEEKLLGLEHAVSRCLAEAESASAGLKAVIRTVCEAQGWECGRYFRADEKAGVLRFADAWGMTDPAIERYIEASRELTYRPGVGLSGKAWQSGRPLWTTDVTKDPRSSLTSSGAHPLRMLGTHGSFNFPLVSGGKTIGVLSFVSRKAHAPEAPLLHAIDAVGSQVGQFLQRKQAEEALRDSEASHANLLKNLSGAVYRCRNDSAWTIEFISDGCLELTGYRPEELLGNRVTSLGAIMHPDDAGPIWEKCQANLAERKACRNEYRIIHRSGEIRWVWDQAQGVYSDSGELLFIEGLLGDITARKQAEAALRESEERFRAIFDSAPVGIMHTTVEDDRIVHANAKLSEMLGYAQGALLGLTTDDIRHPDGRGSGRRRHREEALKGEIVTYSAERMFKRKDGSPLWVNRTVSLVRDAAGKPQYFISMVEDITERKRAAQDQSRLAAIVENSNEAIFSRALDGTILSWNAGAERMLGFTAAEAVGKPIAFTLPPGRPPNLARNNEMLLRGEVVVRESDRITKDGRVIEVLTSHSPIRDGAGNIVGASVILTDISLLKQAQAAVKESEQRFRAIFDSAGVGIAMRPVHDRKHPWIQVNDHFCKLLGYTREELLSLSTADITPPDEQASAVKDNERLLRGEITSYTREKQVVRKDGSRIWVMLAVAALPDAVGRPVNLIAVYQDITERKVLERRRAIEHAVTQVLAASATVEEATPVVLRTICQALGWACGAHWKWHESEELLRCAETWHVDAEGVAEFVAATKENPNEAPAWRDVAPRTSTGGVVRRVWFSGASVWFPDITEQPDFRRGPIAARAGLRSAFGFPILAGTRPLGVMEFYSRNIEQPDEALLQMVRAIGSQIGQFIQRKHAEDKVIHLAQFDTVTSLPNRHLFNDRLGLMLAQAQRNGWTLGILFVDLDRFKTVNDTYGHAAGDMLLRQVAARLKECLRSSDVVGRLSGDEFALVLSNLAKADDAGLVAQKIVGALAAPFDLDGQQAFISASIGIALFPSDGREPDTLIRNADTAMYRVKEQGRDGYQFYLPQMNERLKQSLEHEALLRGALERDEYRLHYQPKVNLETGAISGFEALLRWEHGGRLVSPAEFIPILEYTGLIVPVGEWVVRSACQQIKRWEEQRLAVRPVAVNLSARQFQRKNLVEMIGTILRETGVAPNLLELELTETLLMSDAQEAVATLRELKALGVRLAVDDFGTGYSSLAYLKRFPLDSLKIDRAFIRDAVSDPDDAAITLAITSLAHSLKLKVVAEGVETEGQLNFLRSHGCDEMQGFYFARPLPVEECTRALIEDRRLQFPQAEAAPQSPSVLLVDDNEDELLLLKQALAAEGFRILTANSAQAGFELLAVRGADIVISDQHMPGMTGIEFLINVRKLYPNTVRVVASNGDDAPTLTRATNRAGIHRFLSKSWDPERLRAEVREAYLQRH